MCVGHICECIGIALAPQLPKPDISAHIMPNIITHRRINIVTLAPGETIAEHCVPDDIALLEDEAGWWVHFVSEGGASDTYDAAFDSYNKALWTAKAAAEFTASQ